MPTPNCKVANAEAIAIDHTNVAVSLAPAHSYSFSAWAIIKPVPIMAITPAESFPFS